MNKHLLKSISALLTTVLLLSGLTACGTSEFDATGYTKSVLDANFHHEYTDYAKYREITEAEAIKELEKSLNDHVDAELSSLDSMGSFSAEEKEEYKTIFKKVQELASYEVQDASKEKNGNFTVTIQITPSNVYQTLEENITTTAQEMAKQEIDLTESSNFHTLLIDSMQASIDENVYGKSVSIKIQVKKDSNGTYGISDSDMQKINDTLFPE